MGGTKQMNPEKSEKSPVFLYAFALSLVLAALDAIALFLLTEPLSHWVPFQNISATNALHLCVISLVGTLAGCSLLFVFRKTPVLIPLGYSFFPGYMAVCYAFVYWNVEAVSRSLAYELVTMYTLAPTLWGVALSWTVYLLYKKRR